MHLRNQEMPPSSLEGFPSAFTGDRRELQGERAGILSPFLFSSGWILDFGLGKRLMHSLRPFI